MPIENLQNEVVKAPFSRRVGVAITDLFILLFTFLIFNTYILSPIVASTTGYTKATDEYKEVLLDSNLYILNDKGYQEIIKTYDEKSQTEKEFYLYIDSKLIKFYENYNNENINITTYNEAKEESNLFDTNYTLKNDSNIEEVKEFFNTEYNEALRLFNNYDDNYLDLARTITQYSIIIMISALTISSIILYLIIPLCMKNGETIGKKLFSIGLASAKDGFKVKKTQIIIRFLVFFLLEIILSIFTLGIPLIVSFSMLAFNKNGYSLHDYFAATVCIDRKNTIIYKDYEEFENHERIVLK